MKNINRRVYAIETLRDRIFINVLSFLSSFLSPRFHPVYILPIVWNSYNNRWAMCVVAEVRVWHNRELYLQLIYNQEVSLYKFQFIIIKRRLSWVNVLELCRVVHIVYIWNKSDWQAHSRRAALLLLYCYPRAFRGRLRMRKTQSCVRARFGGAASAQSSNAYCIVCKRRAHSRNPIAHTRLHMRLPLCAIYERTDSLYFK